MENIIQIEKKLRKKRKVQSSGKVLYKSFSSCLFEIPKISFVISL